MNVKIFSGAEKSVLFSLSRIFFIFLFFVIMSGNLVQASVASSVTFSWQANPPEDYVIGYRLYYGANSRFDSSGKLKSNFSYDYYIDFSDLKRRYAGDNFTSCEMLKPEELQCENLYESVPRCNVTNLNGNLNFSLTAYNAQAESSYTPELNLTVNPEGLAAVQAVIKTLLLNN